MRWRTLLQNDINFNKKMGSGAKSCPSANAGRPVSATAAGRASPRRSSDGDSPQFGYSAPLRKGLLVARRTSRPAPRPAFRPSTRRSIQAQVSRAESKAGPVSFIF